MSSPHQINIAAVQSTVPSRLQYVSTGLSAAPTPGLDANAVIGVGSHQHDLPMMANEVNQLGQDRRPLQRWVDLDNPQKWRIGKACAIRTVRRGRRHGRIRIRIK